MHKHILYCLLIILLPCFNAMAQDGYTERAKKYVDQYATLAILEQQKNGIPASITLAQGILETEAGNSELMVEANNHFGIKCKNGWLGETFTHSDDLPDECFKKYKCAQDSYRDHSEHLKRNPRYAPLFTYSTTDYANWAKCLKKCGYATNPQYATKLIKIIEDFGLQQYTYSALDSSLLNNYTGNPVANVLPDQDSVKKAHPAKTVVAPKAAPAAPVVVPKAENTRRIVVTHVRHTVLDGETLASIAQSEGVDVKQIMDFNMLYANEEPVPGTVLELQKSAGYKPAVRMVTISAHKGNAIVSGDENATPAGDYVDIKKARTPAAGSERGQPDAVAPASKPATETRPVVSKPTPVMASMSAVTSMPVAAAPNVAASTPAPATRPAPTARKAVNKTAPPTSEPDLKKDQELATLKAELDKVVYADDSRLIAEHTPPPATKAATTTTKQPEPAAAKTSKYYVVQKGDTAFGIAKKHNITLDQLKKWNNLEAGGVKVGQNLRVQ
jgi:LysM repeat protein